MAWTPTAAVAASALALLLSACGGSATGPIAPVSPAAIVALTPASPPPSDYELRSPDPSAPPPSAKSATPAASDPALRVAAAPPEPAMAPVTQALTFPVQAVNEPLAGTVTIQPNDGSYAVSIQVSGMTPGTVHGVHLHFGTCPSTGVHQLVLGTLRAGANGAAGLVTTVNAPYTGDGRFVIIYVGPNAGPLGGCSQLASRA